MIASRNEMQRQRLARRIEEKREEIKSLGNALEELRNQHREEMERKQREHERKTRTPWGQFKDAFNIFGGVEDVFSFSGYMGQIAMFAKALQQAQAELDELEKEYADLHPDEERPKPPPKPQWDKTDETLAQIKELRRKMDKAMQEETDPELREDIRRAYGKRIDALREKL